MNRYKIVMRVVQKVTYEIDAYNIDSAIENTHNWVKQDEDDEIGDNRILSIELIKEDDE